MSFLQIYIEEITDLLAPIMSPASAGRRLQIREDPEHGIYVEGLNHMIATSGDEVLQAIRVAVSQRATSSTNQNSCSSRSHALLQFTLQQCAPNDSDDAVLI